MLSDRFQINLAVRKVLDIGTVDQRLSLSTCLPYKSIPMILSDYNNIIAQTLFGQNLMIPNAIIFEYYLNHIVSYHDETIVCRTDQPGCCGIQHPKLMSPGSNNAVHSYCRKKRTYVSSRWYVNDCLFVVDPGIPKQRCIKWSGAHSNACSANHPRLLPERPISSTDDTDWVPNDQHATTVHIS